MSRLLRFVVTHPVLLEPFELTKDLLLWPVTTFYERFPIRFQPPHGAPLVLRYPGSGIDADRILVIDPLLFYRPTFDLGDRFEHLECLGREFGHGVEVRFYEESLGGDG